MNRTRELFEESEDEHRPLLAPELTHIQEMNVNVKTREIFVDGDIEEDFGPWFTVALRYLESKCWSTEGFTAKPITIWLNTPGGDINSMFTFHDLVRASKCDITIIGTGQVCSAGVLMLACGDIRKVTESCVLMSHRSEGTHEGNLEQLEALAKVARWQEEHWAKLMARYTPEEVDGKTRDWKYWFNQGKKTTQWWLTGGEAIVHEGLASEVLRMDESLPDRYRDPARARPRSESKHGLR